MSSPQRAPSAARVVALISVAFFARGLFYCVEQPLWEGYDEWGHFAYIQHIAESGSLPLRTDAIPVEIRRSLELVPLCKSAAKDVPGATTHDEYWRLPPEERARRQDAFRSLATASDAPSAVLTQYEAKHPPLYYLLLAIPYLAVRDWPLAARVLVVRMASLAIATLLLPLAYAISKRVLRSEAVARAVVVLLASIPALLIDVCRAGNDSLALVISAAVLLCALRLVRRDAGPRDWLALGAAIAAALLTKAYTLAFLALPVLLAGIQIVRWRVVRRQALAGCALALALPLFAAGWWYHRLWVLTGTLSGEDIDRAAAGAGFAGKVAAAGQVDWWRALDSAAQSHIWLGGWSFVVVRAWMYRVFELFAIAAAAGLVLLAAKIAARSVRRRVLGRAAGQFAIVAAAYLPLCVALAYQSVVIFVVYGTSMGLGWYLYGAVAAEAVLMACGFAGLAGIRRAAKPVAAMAALMLALDVYTVHFVLVPYYTGLVRHRPNGTLEAFHISSLPGAGGIREVLSRMAAHQPGFIGEWTIAALWAAYLCATAALLAYSVALMVRTGSRTAAPVNRTSAPRLQA